MKRILPLLLILLILFPSTASAKRIDMPPLNTNHYFVQDNGQYLSEETTDQLNQLGEHLEKGTGVEMLLMTMPSVGEEHRQDFALRALREYGVGKKDEDNGIVIFFNNDNDNEYNNRGTEVQVGYGIEGYLNDAKIGRIIDDVAMDDLKAGNYEAGLKKLYQALYNESLEAYGYDESKDEFTRDEPKENNDDDSFSSFFINTMILVGIVVFIIYIISKNGGPPRGGGRRYRGSRRPPIFFPTGRSGGSFPSSGGGFGGFGGGSGGGGGAGRGF